MEKTGNITLHRICYDVKKWKDRICIRMQSIAMESLSLNMDFPRSFTEFPKGRRLFVINFVRNRLWHSARWRLGSCPEVSPKFWRFMGCRKLTFNLNFGMLWCSAFWWWKNNPNILTLFKSEKVKEKNNLYILALFKSAKLKVGKYCSVHVFYCVCIVLFNVNIWDLN